MSDELDREMARYYEARAGEYDDWYLRPGRYSHGEASDAAWRDDLDCASHWLDGLPMGNEIVELAAGTGWWSRILARKGHLTMYDIAPQTLEIARARLAEVDLAADASVRDAWTPPDRSVSAVFAGFWLSHVARYRLVEFMALALRWLEPGGIFAFIDSRPDPESGAVDHQPPVDDVQLRRLNDGSTYRVRKVHYSPAQLASALDVAGFRSIHVQTTERFFVLGWAVRQGRPSTPLKT